MMSEKGSGDNFFLGAILGAVTLTCAYLTFRLIRLTLAGHYGNPYFFPAPRVELISILLNVLLFRIVIINLKKESLGRGILFITVMTAIAYFFMFFRYQYQLP